jgi:hypothetical protein
MFVNTDEAMVLTRSMRSSRQRRGRAAWSGNPQSRAFSHVQGVEAAIPSVAAHVSAHVAGYRDSVASGQLSAKITVELLAVKTVERFRGRVVRPSLLRCISSLVPRLGHRQQRTRSTGSHPALLPECYSLPVTMPGVGQMRRRELLGALGGAPVAWPLAARAAAGNAGDWVSQRQIAP